MPVSMLQHEFFRGSARVSIGAMGCGLRGLEMSGFRGLEFRVCQHLGVKVRGFGLRKCNKTID